MITKITNSNASLYNKIFSDATADLTLKDKWYVDEEKDINEKYILANVNSNTYKPNTYYVKDGKNYTLASGEYNPDAIYYEISKITTLEQYFHYIKILSEINKKYTVLPLDEDIFEINANTREITVPKVFKTNGIAVKGDHVAEVLYFRIDRYFDATDLNNMDIYIQWENANGDAGLSKEFVRDIESNEGKLIFGWPISDAITEKAGTIKFSVRFFKFDDPSNPTIDTMLYNFSTLTAVANVNPSLDLDLLNTYQENMTNLIMSRLVNSPLGGYIEAGIPVFIYNISDIFPELSANVGDVLKVQAYSPDAGQISYTWYFKPTKNTPDENATVLTSGYQSLYELTTDEAWDNRKVYWQLSKDGTYVQFDLDDEKYKEDENYWDKVKGGLYELFSIYTIPVVEGGSNGIYFAKAHNQVWSSRTDMMSDHCEVPGPANIIIIADLSDIVLDSADDHILAIEDDQGLGATTYQWFREDMPIDGANKNSYTIRSKSIEEGISQKELEGTYKVVITRTNNGAVVSKESKPALALFAPNVINQHINFLVEGMNTDQVAPGQTVTAVLDNQVNVNEKYSIVTYKWYLGSTLVGTEQSYTIPVDAAPNTNYRVEITHKKGSIGEMTGDQSITVVSN